MPRVVPDQADASVAKWELCTRHWPHVPYQVHPPTGTKRWQVGPALPTTRRRAVHEVYWVRGIGGEVGPSGREVERQVMRG